VVNRSRDIVRQALQWFPEAGQPSGQMAEFARWSAAFPMAMMNGFREDVVLGDWLKVGSMLVSSLSVSMLLLVTLAPPVLPLRAAARRWQPGVTRSSAATCCVMMA
jgi:hypothetical protein